MIITDACVCCGICEELCPEGAISPGDGIYVIDQEKCKKCGICENECPQDAIEE